jgi:hypothetical protein
VGPICQRFKIFSSPQRSSSSSLRAQRWKPQPRCSSPSDLQAQRCREEAARRRPGAALPDGEAASAVVVRCRTRRRPQPASARVARDGARPRSREPALVAVGVGRRSPMLDLLQLDSGGRPRELRSHAEAACGQARRSWSCPWRRESTSTATESSSGRAHRCQAARIEVNGCRIELRPGTSASGCARFDHWRRGWCSMTSGGSLQWRSRAGEERLCSVVREGEPPTTSRAPYSTQGLEGGIWVPPQQVPK